MRSLLGRALFGAPFMILIAGAAQHYKAVSLHPGGFFDTSDIVAASANNQYGRYNGIIGRWGGEPDTFVSYDPTENFYGYISAADGDNVVGYLFDYDAQVPKARIWLAGDTLGQPLPTGTFTDYIVPLGIRWNQVVGAARSPDTGRIHAIYWPAYFLDPIDLTPPGVDHAYAYAAGNGFQVGWTSSVSGNFAALWHGTAGSYVNLNPEGYAFSQATASDGGSQFGMGYQLDSPMQALRWQGSAESVESIHPPAWISSGIYGARANWQVGYVTDELGNGRAGVWTGTAASFVNLHPRLPAGFGFSIAYDVDEFGRVVGLAQVTTEDSPQGPLNATRAYMWVPTTAEQFNISNFLQPVNGPTEAESVFKAGRTVPLKLRITDENGVARAGLTVTISGIELGPSGGTINEVSVNLPQDRGVLFRYDESSGHYIYNLGTQGLRSGYRYRVTATIEESGQEQSVTFTLK